MMQRKEGKKKKREIENERGIKGLPDDWFDSSNSESIDSRTTSENFAQVVDVAGREREKERERTHQCKVTREEK